MGLSAIDAAMGEVLAVEINLQAFDSALDAGAFFVPAEVSGGVLGMVPVDLRKVSAGHSDVPTLTSAQAGRSERAALANRTATLIVRGDPDVPLTGDVTPTQLEAKLTLADRYAGRSEAIDAIKRIGQRGIDPPAVHREDQPCLLTEPSHGVAVGPVGVISQDIADLTDDLGQVALEYLKMWYQRSTVVLSGVLAQPYN